MNWEKMAFDLPFSTGKLRSHSPSRSSHWPGGKFPSHRQLKRLKRLRNSYCHCSGRGGPAPGAGPGGPGPGHCESVPLADWNRTSDRDAASRLSHRDRHGGATGASDHDTGTQAGGRSESIMIEIAQALPRAIVIIFCQWF